MMLPPKRHGSKSECTACVVRVLMWIKSCGGETIRSAMLSRWRSDPHQHSCHEDNDGSGKRHPLRKHHFLPLCVTVPVFRPAASQIVVVPLLLVDERPVTRPLAS
jgi:hypothetical protein